MNIEIDRSTPDIRLMSRTVLIGLSTLLDELNETVAAIPKYIAAAASQPRLPDFPLFIDCRYANACAENAIPEIVPAHCQLQPLHKVGPKSGLEKGTTAAHKLAESKSSANAQPQFKAITAMLAMLLVIWICLDLLIVAAR